ncbi:probable E3 ubiquitin-protein ligase HECTD4 [Danio rerio]|uniref:Probable E3 ubiquitin-protein ligase HECTD4 n=1 Tax=Danio rerio TaxID=7955 RepID=A0AC58ID99_DANRE
MSVQEDILKNVGKKQLLTSIKKEIQVTEEKFLTLEGFYKFTLDRAKQDIRSVWRAILACGYDLHFDRCTCIDSRHAQKASRKWSFEMDFALVQFVNRLSRHLAITPARLHPHEVYLVPSKNGADPEVACRLSVPVESLRLRFALLQSLNSKLENFFLPLVELRLTQTYQNSIATHLCKAKGSCCAVKVLWRVCTAAWPSSTSLPPRVLTHSHTSSTSLQCVTSHLNICSSCPISC